MLERVEWNLFWKQLQKRTAFWVWVAIRPKGYPSFPFLNNEHYYYESSSMTCKLELYSVRWLAYCTEIIRNECTDNECNNLTIIWRCSYSQSIVNKFEKMKENLRLKFKIQRCKTNELLFCIWYSIVKVVYAKSVLFCISLYPVVMFWEPKGF